MQHPLRERVVRELHVRRLFTALALACAGCGASAEPPDPQQGALSRTSGGERSASLPMARGASRTVAGQLTERDPIYEGRSAHHDRHPISLRAGDRLRVIMWSLDFDTYLVLLGPSGEAMIEDDDGSGTLNAYFEHEVETSGVYTIIATSYSQGATGSYALHVHAAPTLPAALNVENYDEGGDDGGDGDEETHDPPVVDQVVNETLTSGDARLDGGRFFRPYTVFAQADDTLHVMMRSDSFDTYLYLLDPTGNVVDSSDDDPTAGGLNSYIVHRAEMSGHYIVRASTFAEDVLGPFELLLGREPAGAQ